MTKKISREFFVGDDTLGNLRSMACFKVSLSDKVNPLVHKNKIKITFDAPERSVTISESQLEEGVLDIKDSHSLNGRWYVNLDSLKEKLFGDER